MWLRFYFDNANNNDKCLKNIQPLTRIIILINQGMAYLLVGSIITWIVKGYYIHSQCI